MEYCKNCGALLPAGATVCPNCGAHCPAQQPQPVRPPAYTQPSGAFPPGWDTAPSPKAHPEPESPLTTAQYLGCLVLFAIPLVGLVFMLVWSFGSGFNPARKRLARAYLIRSCIFVGLISLLLSLFFSCAGVLFPMFTYEEYHSQPYYEYRGTIPGYSQSENPFSYFG